MGAPKTAALPTPVFPSALFFAWAIASACSSEMPVSLATKAGGAQLDQADAPATGAATADADTFTAGVGELDAADLAASDKSEDLGADSFAGDETAATASDSGAVDASNATLDVWDTAAEAVAAVETAKQDAGEADTADTLAADDLDAFAGAETLADVAQAEVADAASDESSANDAGAAKDLPADATADSADVAEAPTGCVASYTIGPPQPNCPTFELSWTCPQPAKVFALAMLPQGGVALAGAIGDYAWLTRVDDAGQTVWQTVPNWQSPATDVTPSSDGGILVITNKGTCGKFSAAGTLLWSLKIGGNYFGPSHLAPTSDGGFVTAFKNYAEFIWPLTVKRYSASGAVVWSSDFPILDKTSLGNFIALPDGGFGLAVTENNSSAVWILDSAGKKLQEIGVGPYPIVHPLPDGGFVAGCQLAATWQSIYASYARRVGSKNADWLTFVSPVPKGIYDDGISYFTDGFAGRADGASMLASTRYEKDKPKLPALSWLGADGQLRWQRGMPFAGAVALRDDGGFWAAGTVNKSATLIRGDRWGNIACAATAACMAKTAGACDDGNVCTSDFCALPGDCTHTALIEQTPCGNGYDGYSLDFSKVSKCLNGVCVAP